MSGKTDGFATMRMDIEAPGPLGLHARPAALFVKIAKRFGCSIFVEKDGKKINGKSVLSLLLLGAGPGSKLTVHAQGQDAPQALAQLLRLVERRFGEE